MAFFRALESARQPEEQLFADPFAVQFLRPSLRCAAQLGRVPWCAAAIAWYADRRLPGARTSAIARTHVIDAAVREAVGSGASQVVILGAGFDCRAYRLPELRSATVFEVDHPATRAHKLAQLRRVVGDAPDNVHSVEIDFNRQRLPEVLQHAGVDRQRRTVFVWEGVTNYLSAAAVDDVLRYVAGSVADSRLVFTYVHRGALDGSARFADAPALLRDVERLGEPWTFGLDPQELAGYLSERGLHLEYDAGAREYRAQCFGRRADAMKGYEFYHVAVARVTGRAALPQSDDA